MGKLFSYKIFLATCIFFISCAGSKHAAQNSTISYSKAHRLKKKDMVQLVDFAHQQLNVPYKWGGNTTKGFDCSGFTSYCFKHFGLVLPRTAIEQSISGKKIRSKKAKVGDLIFFKGSDQKQKKVAHVGIIVSGRKKNIKFIHAANKGVTISQLSEGYFSKRFKTIRRIRR
jgi:murein DD-endopeptidase / murein LD-carboxypeptidase